MSNSILIGGAAINIIILNLQARTSHQQIKQEQDTNTKYDTYQLGKALNIVFS